MIRRNDQQTALSAAAAMILAAAWCAIGAAVAHAEPGSLNERGAVIYRKLCAECHGDRGQGVNDKYEDPLHGSRSLARLTRRAPMLTPSKLRELRHPDWVCDNAAISRLCRWQPQTSLAAGLASLAAAVA